MCYSARHEIYTRHSFGAVSQQLLTKANGDMAHEAVSRDRSTWGTSEIGELWREKSSQFTTSWPSEVLRKFVDVISG